MYISSRGLTGSTPNFAILAPPLPTLASHSEFWRRTGQTPTTTNIYLNHNIICNTYIDQTYNIIDECCLFINRLRR